MKRMISLLLVMVLLLGMLCGCGQDKNSDDTSKEASKTVEWTDGKISDGVYTNECLNLSFQIPEGWIQASEEETRTILNADPNDKSTIYDILLGPTDMNAIMALACLDLRQQIGGTSMTEDELLDEMKEELLDTVELGGASFSEIKSVSLCGREYRSIILTVSVSGITVNTQILLSRLGKDKMVMLTLRASSEAQLAYYMAHFTDDPSTIPAPPVEATPEPAAVFTRGEYNGSSYANEFLGIRFDAPEDWLFSTDRELAALIGLDPESIGDEVFDDPEAVTELFAAQQSIYDMAATAPDSSAAIQLALENLSSVIGGISLTAEDYADVLVEQLRASGYPYVFGDTDEMTLAGKRFTVVPTELDGYGVYQYLLVTRVENYMLVITLSGADASVLDCADWFTEF